MTVKVVPENGAVVHAACVDKTLSCIFEQQITFAILLRLKEFELCVRVGFQSFLKVKKIKIKIEIKRRIIQRDPISSL